MKIKILTSIFVYLLSLNIKAQENNDLLKSRILLSVVMPENNEKIDFSNFSKLKSKIKQIISKNDIGATDYYSDFLIYPSVEIYDEEIIDAGLQPMYIVSGTLTLFVKQQSTSSQFGSVTTNFKGSGNSKYKAIRNGVSKINTNSNKYSNFIKSVKDKIIVYYQNNCNLFLSDASKLNSSRQYEKAIVKLYAIPSGITKCNSRINASITTYYKNYSNSICSKEIMLAKSYMSQKNYNDALRILGSINPESKCSSEALKAINTIGNKIDNEDKKVYDLTLKIYNDRKEMEKAKLKNIKEIALAYYKNQPDTKINIIR